MATTYLKQLSAADDVRLSTNRFRTSTAASWTLRSSGTAQEDDSLIAILVDSINGDMEASQVSESVLQRIRTATASSNTQQREVQARVARGIEDANRDLFYRAYNEDKSGKIGASVIVAIFTTTGDGIMVQLLHVGNCRAYLVREHKLHQLTTDHTWGQSQVETGALPQSDEARHPNWSRPIRFLGANADVTLDRTIAVPKAGVGITVRPQEFQLELGDRIVLCSARAKRVAVESVLSTLHRGRSKAAATAVVKQAAKQRGVKLVANTLGTDVAALVVARRQPRRPIWLLIVLAIVALLAVGIMGSGSRIISRLWEIIQTLPEIGSELESTLTATATATPTYTSTAVSTATVTPTTTETATATATRTARTIEIPTATLRPVAALKSPVPSLVPLYTATNTPIPTQTRTPTNTPPPAQTLATLTPTLTPTLSSTIGVVQPSGLNCEQEGASVSIKQAPESLSQTQDFSWVANCRLADGYGFELGFWKKSSETENDAQACVDTGTAQSQSIDPACFEKRGLVEYNWAIFLAKTVPFQIVKRLSAVKVVRVERPATPNKPEPPVEPPIPEPEPPIPDLDRP